MASKYDMIKVAHMYYDLGCNQQEIAEKLRTSRPRVSRLLKSAVEEGVVKIYVDGYKDSCVDLESRLEERYRLKAARVVEQARSERGTAEIIHFLDSFVEDGMNVGVTFGATQARLTASSGFRPREGVNVVQLMGGLNCSEITSKPDEIANRFAGMFGGKAYSMYIPAIVSNPLLKELMKEEGQQKKIFDLYDNIDVAFLAVGAMLPIGILLKDGYMSREMFDELIAKKAIGDVCFRFYDREGRTVDDEVTQRVTGISTESLMRIPMRIGIAYGRYKAEAIHAAIVAGYLNSLATDAQTARCLLEMSREPV